MFIIVRTFASRIKQCRLNRNDFEIIKTIGQGAFGEGIFFVLIEIFSLRFIFSCCCKNEKYGTNICNENIE